MTGNWYKVFIIVFVTASTLDLTKCGLTLTKDGDDKFYYTVNGQDFPVDFDVGAEIAGLQEKIMFPRDSNPTKDAASVVNVSEDLGWDDPIKRSVKQAKIYKKKEMEDNDIDEGKEGKSEEYEYVDDDAVSNDDVYENEQANENQENNELVTSRPAVGSKGHRQKSHVKGNERQQPQYGDEYYEEYEEDLVNSKKTSKMGKSRNTRNDVIRRFVREILNVRGPEQIRIIITIIQKDIDEELSRRK